MTTHNRLIRLADYPALRDLAWSLDLESTLTPEEALSIYERNWRHIRLEDLDAQERDLVERLTQTAGRGVLLV